MILVMGADGGHFGGFCVSYGSYNIDVPECVRGRIFCSGGVYLVCCSVAEYRNARAKKDIETRYLVASLISDFNVVADKCCLNVCSSF